MGAAGLRGRFQAADLAARARARTRARVLATAAVATASAENAAAFPGLRLDRDHLVLDQRGEHGLQAHEFHSRACADHRLVFGGHGLVADGGHHLAGGSVPLAECAARIAGTTAAAVAVAFIAFATQIAS